MSAVRPRQTAIDGAAPADHDHDGGGGGVAGLRWSAAALLCDLDGTLVDSAATIDQAWSEVAARRRLPATEVRAALPGRTARDILALFLTDPAVIEAEVAWVGRRQLLAAGVTEIAGSARLLTTLPGDRWAVVTAAPELVARARLAAAGLPQPAVLVGAESVTRGKPSPEGFRLAAALLGHPAEQCVVLEDSEVGVRAGRAAGARVVAVGDAAPEADARIPDLRAFTDVDVAGGELRWSLVPA